MKRTIIIPGLLAMVVLGMAAPVYAHDGPDTNDDKSVVKTVENTVEDTVKTTDDAAKSLAERLKEQRERIAERKTELESELQHKKEERKEKLEGRRLAQCQNREDNINSLLDKSAAIGKERLAKIQRIEEGVKAFYEKQQLTSAEYDTVVQTVDEKEAAAVAALDVIETEDFSCDEVDGTKPSDTIHATHEAKRAALKDYRESVQQLIKVVRQAFVDKVQSAEGGNE